MEDLEFKGTRLKVTLNNPRIVVLHELEDEMDAAGIDHTQMDRYILDTIARDANLTANSTVQAVVKTEGWKRKKTK